MKPNPCINPKTQLPFDWENPNFTPGKHCTSCRYKPCSMSKDFPYTCNDCLPKIRAWKIRSDRSKISALKAKRTRQQKGK